MIFKDYDRPDGLVVAILNFPEVDEWCSSPTGLPESTVVAVVRFCATVGVGQESIVCDVVQAVGAVEGGGNRYGYRETLGEPNACRALQRDAPA